jgi:hypothetical protein
MISDKIQSGKLRMLPNILYYDIETGMAKLSHYTYQLKQRSKYIFPDAVEYPVWLACVAWKWHGNEFIASTSVLKDMERFNECYHDDYVVVSTLAELMEKADIIIAHNGDRFDWKMFIARCIHHKISPPPKPIMIDTLKAARREARFMSNSLGYLTKELGLSNKDQSPDWQKIARGCPDEIARAERYCRGDIRSLEALYLRLRPYITNHPNLNAVTNGGHPLSCSKCGSIEIQRRGFQYTNAGKYQRYQCLSCGGWSKDKKNLKTVEIR